MYSMFVLTALAALAIPVIAIWLVVSHLSLRKTVQGLSAEVAALKSKADAPVRDLAPITPRKQPAKPFNPYNPANSPKSVWTAATEDAPLSSPPPMPEATPDAPPKSFVFDAANIGRLFAWAKENWFIVVAAVSLAMAGVFLVQYGIENGVLSPTNRVLCALVFGAGLIGFGEWVRRRVGDEHGATAFLPSAFAGAGVVTLFSALLSARQMYDLIGKEVAFGGLVGVAALAVLLGWLYGPLVTAIGLTGAVAAPFLVSDGTSENVTWLFYYFALISAVGLGVDAMKRSAWISTLGLVLPYLAATYLWMLSGSENVLAFAALVALAAVVVPTVRLRPAFDGAMTFERVTLNRAAEWPQFPTRLAAAGILALAAVAVPVSMSGEAGFWLALAALALTLFALGYWLNRSTTLDDVAVPVALALLACIGVNGMLDLDVAQAFLAEPARGESPSGIVTALTALGIGLSILAGYRSLRDTRHDLPWAAGAAIIAPATVVLLALYWQPLTSMSPVYWACHALAVAIVMTVFAEQTLRAGNRGGDAEGVGRLRLSVFALAALNMTAFALSIVLTETALTLAFAGVAVSAAWLDRKFDIRPVSWFVQGAVALCSYRLVVDPGVFWAIDTSLLELCIGYLGTIALIAAAFWLVQHRERQGAMMVTESAIWSLGAIFACLLLFRALENSDLSDHSIQSLFGMIWLISAATQFYRVRIGGIMAKVRTALGWGFAAFGLTLLGLALTIGNPLMSGEVVGPPIVDSLMVAYLLPAALLAFVAWRFTHLDRRMRLGAGGIAILSATAYIGLQIRRLWQGTDLTVPGVVDGELYSYTLAMLLTGSVLLGLALLRKSHALRAAAFAIIGLTIAKVFLIDMSGLEGLTRVLSFLALGLVLAGLALLNRWVSQALGEAEIPMCRN